MEDSRGFLFILGYLLIVSYYEIYMKYWLEISISIQKDEYEVYHIFDPI